MPAARTPGLVDPESIIRDVTPALKACHLPAEQISEIHELLRRRDFDFAFTKAWTGVAGRSEAWTAQHQFLTALLERGIEAQDATPIAAVIGGGFQPLRGVGIDVMQQFTERLLESQIVLDSETTTEFIETLITYHLDVAARLYSNRCFPTRDRLTVLTDCRDRQTETLARKYLDVLSVHEQAIELQESLARARREAPEAQPCVGGL